MDLRIFHPDPAPAAHGTRASHDSQATPDTQASAVTPNSPLTPPRNFKMMDRLNGWTGLLPCRFLEWSGWYNYSVRLRLLGHYRLYQHFKKDYDRHPRDLPAARAYILQYRTHHGIKYVISKTMAFLFSAVTWNEYYPVAEMAAFNRILINGGSAVLQEFLAGADADFAEALRKAQERIGDPSFFTTAGKAAKEAPAQVTQGATGKKAGVFSVRQTLIFFDLLSQLSNLEEIEMGNPNKKEAQAGLLFALTGIPVSSFLEAFKDYRRKGIYRWDSQSELTGLITTLTNMAEIFRKSHFRRLYELADEKIDELNAMKE